MQRKDGCVSNQIDYQVLLDDSETIYGEADDHKEQDKGEVEESNTLIENFSEKRDNPVSSRFYLKSTGVVCLILCGGLITLCFIYFFKFYNAINSQTGNSPGENVENNNIVFLGGISTILDSNTTFSGGNDTFFGR